MPDLPKRACPKPGCRHLIDHYTPCPVHGDRKQQRQQYDAQRGSAHSRGYDKRWQASRTRYLAEHPLCEQIKTSDGRTLPTRHPDRPALAAVVDHITPHRGDQELFWDENNWQPLCKGCHDWKTATLDGGFASR